MALTWDCGVLSEEMGENAKWEIYSVGIVGTRYLTRTVKKPQTLWRVLTLLWKDRTCDSFGCGTLSLLH